MGQFHTQNYSRKESTVKQENTCGSDRSGKGIRQRPIWQLRKASENLEIHLTLIQATNGDY